MHFPFITGHKFRDHIHGFINLFRSSKLHSLMASVHLILQSQRRPRGALRAMHPIFNFIHIFKFTMYSEWLSSLSLNSNMAILPSLIPSLNSNTQTPQLNPSKSFINKFVQATMEDVWSWMCDLSNSKEWTHSKSLPTLQLTTTTTKSVLLKAQRIPPSSTTNSTTDDVDETLITFSICIQGFSHSASNKTLWVSSPCPLHLSPEKTYLPLLLQLIQEIIACAPTSNDIICPRSQLLQNPKQEPVSWILETHSPESFSKFFNFLMLCRLFWICVCESPSEVGDFYFNSLLAPNLNLLLTSKNILRTFLISIGTDAELCFMRTLGYMLAKWLIVRDIRVGLQLLATPLPSNGFSYATESHGFWVLKGYTPVSSMTRVCSNGQDHVPILDTKETVLKYALAHQQLEVVLQLEYFVTFYEGFIQVNVRVDNIRIHVVKLGFKKKKEEGAYENERHFPSRIRVWVGPEVGSNYVAGLSLGRSTENHEKEVEMKKLVKGSSGKVRIAAKLAMKRKTRNWRWEQDAEGNAAIFEAVLCDTASGVEVAAWKPNSGGGPGGEGNPKNGLKNRYSGGNRLFNKTGGLVFAGDECGEGVGWRLNRDMEGSVLKWRLGGKIWLSYWPNEIKSSHFETRCVDWCEEVDLPLIPVGKFKL